MGIDLQTDDCKKAIKIAVQVLKAKFPREDSFKLISVTNLLKGVAPPIGPTIWEVIFKPVRLIPRSASQEVGAGGELMLRIDVARHDNPIRLTHGE